MTAIQIPALSFRDAHGFLTDAADKLENWTPRLRPAVTDAEIDELIERIAETGHYEDELGKEVKASDVIYALAQDWVDDPMKLPGYTYTAFVKWATCTCALAKFGKR